MNLSELIARGEANPVLLLVMAIALGALHGLEPGHSKTMIAAYVIAIRGTVGQAVLLGLSAAFSHVVIVWILALLGLHYGDDLIGERMEPWFIMASGAIILLLSVWMLWQSWHARKEKSASRGLPHGEDADHSHPHHPPHDPNGAATS